MDGCQICEGKRFVPNKEARVGASTGGGHREARVGAIALAGIKVSVQAGRKGGC